MSENNITEGDWEFDKKLQNIMASSEDKDEEVAYIAEVTELDAQHTIANGQLIAAAPDLLEACEIALQTLKDKVNYNDLLETINLLEKAVAKAKGQDIVPKRTDVLPKVH